MSRSTTNWQLILADLALILFLVTAAALTARPAHAPTSSQTKTGHPALAPTQALYRPGPNLPSIEEWLASQTPDPRAALTIFAQHRANDAEAVWQAAQDMATIARDSDVRVRVIVREGDTSEVYASLAYDQPLPTDSQVR